MCSSFFPLLYTIGISFSNYSSTNLLSEERVRDQLMSQTYQAEGNAFDLVLYPDGDLVRLYLESQEGQRFVSSPLNVANQENRQIGVQPADAPPAQEALGMRDIIQAREALQGLRLITPDGNELRMAGLRQFAPMVNRYEAREDGALYDRRDERLLTPRPQHWFLRG